MSGDEIKVLVVIDKPGYLDPAFMILEDLGIPCDVKSTWRGGVRPRNVDPSEYNVAIIESRSNHEMESGQYFNGWFRSKNPGAVVVGISAFGRGFGEPRADQAYHERISFDGNLPRQLADVFSKYSLNERVTIQ